MLAFPRALLPQVKARPELAQTGVYLLSLVRLGNVYLLTQLAA